MASDRTRSSDDLQQGYRGIAAQQGRVILDRDINAMQTMLGGELRRETLDIVGPCGTPDDGFAISLPTLASPVQPVLTARPVSILPASFASNFVLSSPPPPDPFDFLIGPGTMYLGGLRAVFAAPPANALAISYDHQPDWLSPTPPVPDPPEIEFIYLDVAEQEVSAIEDDDLRDIALGGPDTTQRIRLMQRVKRLGVADGTCSASLADATTAWSASGLTFDAARLRLVPQVRLKVGFSDVQAAASPCEPSSTGGYLGADNQLIRVMITGSGTLVWGFDNASFVYRVSAQPDLKTLQLAETPVDAYHRPARNQAVEVLRGAAILPNGTVVAEATGRITSLASPYDGTSIVLNDPLTDAEVADPHLFLRIWQDTATFVSGQSVILGSTGLTVTLQLPTGTAAGAALSVGAYWMIAVRPSTPQQVYPGRLLNDFQVADGPARWICPLAVIDWTASPGPIITDCRAFFDDLVELSRRRSGGCCTITLRPADVAQSDPTTVINQQIALTGVPAGAVTICLSPGRYSLLKPLRLDARHRGLTIEACSGEVLLSAANATDPVFLDGLIVVDQSTGITLRGIDLAPPAVPFAAAIIARNVANAETVAAVVARFGNVAGMVGIRVVQSFQITVTRCLFAFQNPTGVVPFSAGILVSGVCPSLSVTHCTFARAAELILRPGLVQVIPGSLRETVLTRATPNAALASAATTPANATTGATGAAASGAATGSEVASTISLAKTFATTTTARLSSIAGTALARVVVDNQQVSAHFGLVWATALTVTNQQGDQTEQIVLPARIDDLTMTDCTFVRLTAAVLTVADTGTVRLADNALSDSKGGFWLDATGLGSNVSITLFLRNINGMADLLSGSDGTAVFGLLLTLLYPLPAAVDAANFTTTPSVQMLISNNQLSAAPIDGSQSGAGLLVLTTFSDALSDPNAVVSVTGNQITNRSSQNVGGSGVFIGPLGGLVISGNLLANVQAPAAAQPGAVTTAPPCLLLEVTTNSAPAGGPTAATLAVSGNTLRGGNNLEQNLRSGFAAPLNNWTFANAIVT